MRYERRELSEPGRRLRTSGSSQRGFGLGLGLGLVTVGDQDCSQQGVLVALVMLNDVYYREDSGSQVGLPVLRGSPRLVAIM